jgi:Domain of unknown function (DUF4123)
MTYLDYENAMLERFRAKHRELLATHRRVHLYAVLDQAALSWHENQYLGSALDALQRMSLYAGSGLGDLEAIGPALLAMPDLRSAGPLTSSSFSTSAPTPADMFVRLLALARRNTARVTWVWTPHEMGTLVEHLQTLLHARLGADNEDAWFFFYQPSHLKVLHELLPDVTRRHVFGPIHAWWTLDLHGGLVELAGEGAPVPRAWEVFPVPADVVTALQREAMPVQVHAWLQKTRLNPTNARDRNGQVAEIAPLVKRALDYGLASKADVVTFVVYGLRYRVDYDQHPHLQALLIEAATQSRPLAHVYRGVSSDVWRELAQDAQQRVDAQTGRARHAVLKNEGHVRIRARIVNASGAAINNLYFDLPGSPQAKRQYVGTIEGRLFGEVVHQRDELLAPLPGEKLTLHWQELVTLPSGGGFLSYRKRDLVVEGDVPLDDRSGLLEIWFGQFGQAMVMHRDEASCRNMGRKQI